jgi:hypothetical protein
MCRLPGHGETMCGWLLPGPYSFAPVPPRATTPSPAVEPLPYRFVWSAAAPAELGTAFAHVH